jgi:tetratricopeptide (TPR) repeat protein
VPAPGVSDPTVQPPPAPSTPETEALKQMFDAGVQLFLQQRYEEALGQFQALVATDAKHGEGWLAVAHASFALGRYGEAGQAIAKAAALGAFPRGYRFDPKPIYKGEGEFEALFQRLEQHVRANREDVDAHLLAAYFHVALGKTAQANLEISWVLNLRPGDPTAEILRVAMEPPPPPQNAPTAPVPGN